MVVATLLHPSRETATTIVASEPRLVAAHVVYTLTWFAGAPQPSRVSYAAAQRVRDGTARARWSFLTAFSGTYLIAVDRELRFFFFFKKKNFFFFFCNPKSAGGDHQWVG